jgi:hypothetical protein
LGLKNNQPCETRTAEFLAKYDLLGLKRLIIFRAAEIGVEPTTSRTRSKRSFLNDRALVEELNVARSYEGLDDWRNVYNECRRFEILRARA